jgi:hypothetical protein
MEPFESSALSVTARPVETNEKSCDGAAQLTEPIIPTDRHAGQVWQGKMQVLRWRAGRGGGRVVCWQKPDTQAHESR